MGIASDSKTATTLSQALAQRVLEFSADAVPQAVLDEAARRVLDTLACAYGALNEVAALATLRAVASTGGLPECTVIGQTWRTSVGNAALANGTLVRCLDLNDLGIGLREAGHPSDNIPVALAMGERLNATGREVLTAIVLGYEIYGRMPSPLRAWAATTNSAVVAAAMCGYLMKLPSERLVSAIGLSVGQCSTLAVTREGVAGKSTANAMTTYTAIMQTLMAAEGVTGPPRALEEYSRFVYGGTDLSALAQALDGPEFLIMSAGMKAHPAIGTAQTAIEAALSARTGLTDPMTEIEHIDVRMADVPFVRHQVDHAGELPRTREAADHSFPFLVAVTVLDGKLTLRQFENERWVAPDVLALIARMSVVVDASLNQHAGIGSFPCRVIITTRDGRKLSAEVPYHPGHVKNRMGWEGVQAKFHRWTEEHLPAAQRNAIVDATVGLSRTSSIRELMALVGAN